jgi:hypothetical protein
MWRWELRPRKGRNQLAITTPGSPNTPAHIPGAECRPDGKRGRPSNGEQQGP